MIRRLIRWKERRVPFEVSSGESWSPCYCVCLRGMGCGYALIFQRRSDATVRSVRRLRGGVQDVRLRALWALRVSRVSLAFRAFFVFFLFLFLLLFLFLFLRLGSGEGVRDASIVTELTVLMLIIVPQSLCCCEVVNTKAILPATEEIAV